MMIFSFFDILCDFITIAFICLCNNGNVRQAQTDLPCWAVPADLLGIGPNPNNVTFPYCCTKGITVVPSNETEELAFPRSIASHVVENVPAITNGDVTFNTKRIFMSGQSNGCMMAFSMAMKHSDLVAAVCCRAGLLLSIPSEDYIPTPIWFSRGKLDSLVLYNGTEVPGYGPTYVMPGPQAGYDYFRTINGCTNLNQTFLI